MQALNQRTLYIAPPKYNENDWQSSPPPGVGWWPASTDNDAETLRWWDGTRWSIGCHCSRTADESAWAAAQKSNNRPGSIYWTHRWWTHHDVTVCATGKPDEFSFTLSDGRTVTARVETLREVIERHNKLKPDFSWRGKWGS
jgi:hypothetical protein